MDSLTSRRKRRPSALVEALEPRTLLSFTFLNLASMRAKTTGSQPQGLVTAGDGIFYGVATTGGSKGYGTVFKLNASTHAVTTLVSFTGANGILPRGNLVLDSDGNLFGTTTGGGAFGKGTIWEVAAGTTSSITTLASFNGTNGGFPLAGLTVDSSGNLFGTTIGGRGAHSTVFELATGSSAITVLATFKTSDLLTGSLVVNNAGTIFGTTQRGGASGRGSVFRIAGSSHTLTTLVSFNGTNGANPDGGLLLDIQGNITGLTAAGGTSGLGTLFRVPATASSTIVTLATFKGPNGKRPIGNLVVDVDDNLYGVTASGGGSNSAGTLFELPATSSTLLTLHIFNAKAQGRNPTGALVINDQGSIWGGTYLGGANNSGTLFELHNDSSVFSPPPVQAARAAPTATLPALQLVVTQAPVSLAAGKPFELIITLQDANGQVVDAGDTITLSLASAPADGLLGGTQTINLVHGVGTFDDVTLTGSGNFTLKASSQSGDVLTGTIQVT